MLSADGRLLKTNNKIIGKIYGMYFNTGLSWSGVMLMLYIEIRKLVNVAVIVNKLT